MDTKQCMIVDLEKFGDNRMFITEQVASICENKNGLWTIRFSSSPRMFNYNHSRLLYLTNPETINLGEKGLYIKNKRINDVAELLRFTNGHYTFYRVIIPMGTMRIWTEAKSISPVLQLTRMAVLLGIIFASWLPKQDC